MVCTPPYANLLFPSLRIRVVVNLEQYPLRGKISSSFGEVYSEWDNISGVGHIFPYESQMLAVGMNRKDQVE